jgi:hypothetical protein
VTVAQHTVTKNMATWRTFQGSLCKVLVAKPEGKFAVGRLGVGGLLLVIR